ncbi:MAG TPA: hypothetical protein VGR37_06635 [Longimicrobiaceae bacterium]|nr:hypothetical protein [Longimicrobiaceae bacterium]
MAPCAWLVVALATALPSEAPDAGAVPADMVCSVPAADTIPPPAVVEYSDWYGRRLAIHRAASYTMLPLFAAQYTAGQRMYGNPALPGDDWARRAHRPLAYAVAGLFTLNTATGVWNLWEGRKEPEGRGRRTLHAVLMLAADAGFTATGVLGDRAANQGGSRTMHRNVALGSMATAIAGYLVMLPQVVRD